MNAAIPTVILHADSFGLHPALNEGIERAHRYGMLTSAAIVCSGSALDDAIGRAHAMPMLDLGLQFTLTNQAGCPLTFPRLAREWLRGELGPREAAGRLRQQLDLLRRVHGISLSHIALAPRLCSFPPLMRVVCAVAMEYAIPAVRRPLEETPLERLMGARACRSMASYGIQTATLTVDCQGSLQEALVRAQTQGGPGGAIEIICRPFSDDASFLRAYPNDRGGEQDLAALCDSSLYALVRARRLKIISWRDLSSR